jgi:large subunit ribosomal protein L29
MSLKPQDLRSMTPEELSMKLESLREELFRLHYEARTGRVEKPHRLQELRRDVARVMTIINEKEKTGAKR